MVTACGLKMYSSNWFLVQGTGNVDNVVGHSWTRPPRTVEHIQYILVQPEEDIFFTNYRP